MTIKVAAVVVVLAWAFGSMSAARADDLYRPGDGAALAADRTALHVGETLVVVIDESSTASDTAQSSSAKQSRLAGLLTGGAFNKSGSLDLSSAFSGNGQTARTQKMLAEISVVVQQVLPNGDLEVAGTRALTINGERANIRVHGRVRPQDIATDNTVLSTRLADAVINFDGAGFVTRTAKPGVLTRIFNWIGLP